MLIQQDCQKEPNVVFWILKPCIKTNCLLDPQTLTLTLTPSQLNASLTAKPKIKPKIVLKKQHVSQEELFPDPVLPKLKQSRLDNRPQKVSS